MIEILNKVVHTVTKKEEGDKEVIKAEPNYEGLWIVTPFEENDYWFLKTGYINYALITIFLLSHLPSSLSYTYENIYFLLHLFFSYYFAKFVLEVAMEALEEFTYPDDEITTAYKSELAIISAPTILFTLEAGVGNKTLPMLLLHVSFQSNINDWSTKTVIAFFNREN